MMLIKQLQSYPGQSPGMHPHHWASQLSLCFRPNMHLTRVAQKVVSSQRSAISRCSHYFVLFTLFPASLLCCFEDSALSSCSSLSLSYYPIVLDIAAATQSCLGFKLSTLKEWDVVVVCEQVKPYRPHHSPHRSTHTKIISGDFTNDGRPQCTIPLG